MPFISHVTLKLAASVLLSLSLIHCGGSDNRSPTDTNEPPIVIDNPDTPTDPETKIDTDGDGLSDAEEILLGTDISLVDSDEDGLTDFEEAHTNTDPLLPDTDGDGIVDGEDSFISFIENNDGVHIALEGYGFQRWNTSIETTIIDHPSQTHPSANALIGDAWNIHYESSQILVDGNENLSLEHFTGATLTLPYPENYPAPDDLTLATWNSALGIWQPIAQAVTVNKVNHTLTANVPHFSTWAVMSKTEWDNFVFDYLVNSDLRNQVINILARQQQWQGFVDSNSNDWELTEEDNTDYQDEWLVTDLAHANALTEFMAVEASRITQGDSPEAQARKAAIIAANPFPFDVLADFENTHSTAITSVTNNLTSSFSYQLKKDIEATENLYRKLAILEKRYGYYFWNTDRFPDQLLQELQAVERTIKGIRKYAHYHHFINFPLSENANIDMARALAISTRTMQKLPHFLEEYAALRLQRNSCSLLANMPVSDGVKAFHGTTIPYANVFDQYVPVSFLNLSKTLQKRVPLIRGITTSYKVVDSFLLASKNFLQSATRRVFGIKETVKSVESNPADTSPVIVPKDELDLAKTEAEAICRDPCEDDPDSRECKCSKNPDSAECLYNWGNESTLGDHFDRHGKDFDAVSKEEYAQKAQKFIEEAYEKGYSIKEDRIAGVTRVYDRSTGAFGSYNTKNLSTRTYFKPRNPENYWNNQPGTLIQ